MKKLPDHAKEKVRVQAFDDIMQSFMSRSSDPVEGVLFNGKKLLTDLDKYGRPTLEAMFGKTKTNELYRLGRVNQFVSQKWECLAAWSRPTSLHQSAMSANSFNSECCPSSLIARPD